MLGQCYGLNYDSVDAQRLIFRTPAHPNLVPQPGKPQFDFVPSVIVNMNFTTELPQPGFAAIVYARLGKAQNASTGAMLLDTVMPAQGAVQTDFTGLSNPDQQGGVWERDVVLRHGNNTANVAFWDGHVDRLGVGDFNNLGAKHILDANCNVLLGP